MKQIKFIAVLVFLFGFGPLNIHAQDAKIVSGGEAVGTGGSVNYSLGQLGYCTHTSTYASMAGGVQQPYEISVVAGSEGNNGIRLSVLAYPNPSANHLMVEVKNHTLQEIGFKLYDLQGVLLLSVENAVILNSIDMSSLTPAAYFLKVYQEDTELKTFIIIKN